MVEFVVVGPIVTLLGLAILQYAMLFFAKNQINHASFMAARAGSMGNAKMATITDAYVKALVPMYGGGKDTTELAAALVKAKADTAGNIQVELLNPTKESFDDNPDDELRNKYGARAIRNANQAFAPTTVKANSGQSIQDANLIKLRITHGYEPKVPLMKLVYTSYLKWLDPKSDAFHTKMVNAGRIPVVTHVTLQMQSDAVEDVNVSTPGRGNNGSPSNPGDPPVTTEEPPNCLTIGCTVVAGPITPTDPGGDNGGGNPGDPGSGGDTPICTDLP